MIQILTHNCSESGSSEDEDEELTEDESEYDEDIDLSDMFFRTYGKGFLLTPPSNHELFGEKYLLNGWWMAKHKSWFFKSEFEDVLLDHGAIKVTEKKNTGKTSKKTVIKDIKVISSSIWNDIYKVWKGLYFDNR